MASPIRVKGAGGGSLPVSGMIVEYEAPDDELWTLHADGGNGRIFLEEEGVAGLAGRVEWTESESVTGYGVRDDGWRVPPLEITLDYVLRAPAGELDSLARRWEQAWNFAQPGKLRLRSVVGGSFWTPVSDPVFPDWPNSLRLQRSWRAQMTCRGKLGHWFGDTRRFTGAVTVRVPGDRPLSPSCRLVWDGAATSVTFPSGLRVNLPAIGATRYINLDRGMSGQMTRPDGTVDTGGWSSLQGVVSGISLAPNVPSEWVLGDGLTLEVTPRFLSPWR